MKVAMHSTPQRHDRYPGTRPFADNEVDQRLFFGRDYEIHQLLHQLLPINLLVLFGKSGLGKTSLLQAGVFPRLREYALLPLTVRLNDTERPPRTLFFEAIAEQCRHHAIDYTPGETASLWEFFKTALFLRGETLQTPVLVLDQFEELFTLQDPARRAAIVHELADLASSRLPEQIRARRRAGETLSYSERPPEVKLVLSLREDYLGALQELTTEIPTILEERFRLAEFGEKQARLAMEEPAKLADEALFSTRAFCYEEEVIAQVLTFLQGHTGIIEPFQLQILCQHIEQQVRLEQARGQEHIRVDQRYLGDTRTMEAILANFYKNAMQKITPRRQRNRARRLCEEGLLNRLGQRLSLEERQILETYRVSPQTLNTLVDIRLLRKEPRLESFFYEISHDSLAQPIARSRRFRIPKPVLYGGFAIIAALGLIGFILLQRQQYAIEQQQHVIELAELRAQQAQTEENIAKQQKENAEAAAAKARRARDEAERLLSFLLFDLRDKLQPIGRLNLIEDVQKRVNDYYERMDVNEDNAAILRQRSVAYNNQGELLYAQGNLAGALQAYQNGLTIAQKLAAQDSGHAGWQRDLSVSYNKVGDVLVDQGQLTEALQAYRDSLAIAQKLAAQDPGNAGWQIDLVVSFWKISSNLDVATEAGKQEAKEKLEHGLQILRNWQAQGRLAPTYQSWIGTFEKRLKALQTAGDGR